MFPPGEPVAIKNCPLLSNTMVGDMDERGFLFGATALTIGKPLSSVCLKEKSVNSLFKNMPPTIRVVPNILSTVAVIDTTSPWASTMTK